MKVADLNQVLYLAGKVRELQASHLQEAPGVVGMGRRLRAGILLVEAVDHVQGIEPVRVKLLNHEDLVLNPLQLIAVCHVSLALQCLAHARQAVAELLPLAIALGLGGRRGGATVEPRPKSGRGSLVDGHHGQGSERMAEGVGTEGRSGGRKGSAAEHLALLDAELGTGEARLLWTSTQRYSRATGRMDKEAVCRM